MHSALDVWGDLQRARQELIQRQREKEPLPQELEERALSRGTEMRNGDDVYHVFNTDKYQALD